MASAVIQGLIEKGLFERLPATFSTFFFEQIKDWGLLFPAEQSYFERLFTLLDAAPADETEALFARVRVVEREMGVSEKTWPRRTFTLEQVDFLNRNAKYAEWRRAIADVFARIDPVLDAQVARKGRPRLVMVVSPADLPVGPDRMWTRLKGRRVGLVESIDVAKHLAPLFALGAAEPYDRWIIDAGAEVAGPKGTVVMGYTALDGYRRRLMGDVQRMVEKENIRGPRELGARLKTLKLLATEGEIGRDPLLAEFARSVLLAGNGTLLVNNTFVEWATVQAARRARPSMIAALFGIRNKMKPFSSLLIYTDQDEANPIPSQVDTLGSYVDLEIFYQYVWQEFEKYVEYRNNTAYLFVASGMDELLYIAPRDFTLPEKVTPERVASAAREWMQL